MANEIELSEAIDSTEVDSNLKDALARYKGEINDINGLDSALASKARKTDLDQHKADITNPHNVTKGQLGIGYLTDKGQGDKFLSDNGTYKELQIDAGDMKKAVYDTDNSGIVDDAEMLGGKLPDFYATESDLQDHIADTNNPHTVTKAQVGLGNVQNLAPDDMPISTATQAALDAKADKATLQDHENDTNNPHSVTKAQLGIDYLTDTGAGDKYLNDAGEYKALPVDAYVSNQEAGKTPVKVLVSSDTDNFSNPVADSLYAVPLVGYTPIDHLHPDPFGDGSLKLLAPMESKSFEDVLNSTPITGAWVPTEIPGKFAKAIERHYSTSPTETFYDLSGQGIAWNGVYAGVWASRNTTQANNDNYVIWYLGVTDSAGKFWLIGSDDTNIFYSLDGGTTVVDSGIPIGAPNEFNYYTYNNGKLYFNNQLVVEDTANKLVDLEKLYIQYGNSYDFSGTTASFKLRIDETQVYNRALTDEEQRRLYEEMAATDGYISGFIALGDKTVGIGEAPQDGRGYYRQSGKWYPTDVITTEIEAYIEKLEQRIIALEKIVMANPM